MNKKLLLSPILCGILCSISLNASSGDIEKQTKNKNLSGVEKGFHYGESKTNKEEENKEITLKEMFAKLIEIEEKQEKHLKSIKEMLQTKLDPQPKKFINKDGKECIENESADCYKYPILAEGKRQPVLAKFLQNPNVENGIEYKKWEDKHFSHVENIGYSMKYAVLNSKQKSKTLIDSTSMLSGKYKNYLFDAKIDVVANYAKNINIYILMSDDGREFMNVRKGIIASIQSLKKSGISPDIIFSSNEALENFKNVMKSYDSYILEQLEAVGPNYIVSSKTHKAINPIAYPTYIMKYNDKKEHKFMQIFGAGNSQGSDFVNNIFEMLVLNKVIDRNVINNSVLQEYELRAFQNKLKKAEKK